MQAIMRRLAQAMQGTPARIEIEEGVAFRTSGTEVQRLVDAMLGNSAAQKRMRSVVGTEGDVEALMMELNQELPIIVANCVARAGGQVSGKSGATVKAAMRDMAQGGAK
jgi:hypothetical protein